MMKSPKTNKALKDKEMWQFIGWMALLYGIAAALIFGAIKLIIYRLG